MKRILTIYICLCTVLGMWGADKKIVSPDGKLVVTVTDEGGNARYAVTYNGKTMLQPSALGFKADFGDFTKGLSMTSDKDYPYKKQYEMKHAKKSHVCFEANASDISFENGEKWKFTVTFVVSNHDIAFRYQIPRQKNDNPKCAVIYSETSSFQFPAQTTTFLSPQSTPMQGFGRSKPSYEEEYTADAPLNVKSRFGVGYTFPCLFRIGDDGWVLVSETGVDGGYVGSRLSDYNPQQGYSITFPQERESNGNGTTFAGIPLPGTTPWRTITVGETLAPIVETTIPYDVVSPRYEASCEYVPGRYTWSWLVWQDKSINYDDQVQFIDLAARFGYEYVLVDNWWDQNIGRERMAELSRYAISKKVHLMLWYNSNGYANDAPQTPRNIMNNAIERKKEMKWLRSIGVTGIKVDFFGGDKQHIMQLYEDILSDANDYGLQVIFHGCTLPRGWERMFPNFISSEAALASENIMFSEHHAKREGFEMSMHPFSRNAVASFDWGGVILNKRLSKDNKSRHPRYTSNVFELATAITNQSALNCVALTPNVVDDLTSEEVDFLKTIPIVWEDTKYVDGYPARYAVIARKDAVGKKWYVGGINGMEQTMHLSIHLPMLAGKEVSYLYDNAKRQTEIKKVKVKKDGTLKVQLLGMGGFVIVE